jgi:hypothetical protein
LNWPPEIRYNRAGQGHFNATPAIRQLVRHIGTTCAFLEFSDMKRIASVILVSMLVGCSNEPPVEQKPASVFDYAAPAPTTAAPVQPATPSPPASERVAAGVGVGKKGRGYGGGIVTEPVHQYFTAKERLAFEVQVPKAMQLYKAEHDNKGPATHEAFMKNIIEANSIPLPELPAGHRYQYDPKSETLMVERPAGGNQTE